MKIHLLVIAFFLINCCCTFAARLSGVVTDENEQPLPYVSVYLEGTSKGTTTNVNGEYFLELPAGEQVVVFKYVGYKTMRENVKAGDQPITLNVKMKPQSIELSTVEVNADGEDPAYPIIRKAQDKRKFYLDQVDKYSCKIYIKGMNYLENVPESILGQSIDIMGLDSTRSGIVYLSESVSRYYYDHGREKEEIISSKVSGRSQGFTWNSSLDFDVNFYETNLDLRISERNFISPIAPTAMLYYRYQFEGFYTENGRIINKIKLIPKTSGAPLFQGYIYIQEESWRIHEVDFLVTKTAGVEFVDTLEINQVYIPVSDSIWMLGTQSFKFKFSVKLLGVQGRGSYIGVYSDYETGLRFEDKFFRGPLVKVEEESNQREKVYWDSVRIVPLTQEELTDYEFKDSLEVLRESKVYLDSIDAESNRYRISNLLFGYERENSYRDSEWDFPALFTAFQYNTVEGIVLNAPLSYQKFNDEQKSRTNASATLRYGFSSERFYYKAKLQHRFNAINRMNIGGEGGRFIFQFNRHDPISPLINTLYTLLLEDNFMKLYEKKYARLWWGRELLNGLRFNTSVEFARRIPLRNASNLTKIYWDRDSREFSSNDPLYNTNFNYSFFPHNAFIWGASLRITIAQDYYLYPKQKFSSGSKYPEITINYEKAIPGFVKSITNYDHLQLQVDDHFKLGIIGESEFIVKAGSFINTGHIEFMDYKHFNTSEVIWANTTLNSFKAMSYYQNSTFDDYLEAHYEHHFNGFLFNKLPLLKKLGWQVVAGGHTLLTAGYANNYFEVTTGIEHIFKIGRADAVFVFDENGQQRVAFRVSAGF